MQSKLSVDMFRPVRSARAYGARRKCCGPSSSAGASRRLRFARAEPEQPDARSESSAKRTMAGLDALLGIDEEEEKRKQEEKEKAEEERRRVRDQGSLNVTVSPDALKEMQRAEGDSDSSPELRKLVERLKEASGKKDDVSIETIADEIKSIARSADGSVSQDVVRVIKREILGMKTFLITDVQFDEQPWRLGAVTLRGNCRVEPRQAAHVLETGLKERYGDKYMVYLAYDTVEMEERADGKKRITLSVLPRDKGTPAGTPGWAVFLQVVLVALTITSVLSLSALVAVPKLPAATLAFLASPDAADLTGDVPGLQGFDPAPFSTAFMQTVLGLIGASSAHELGHSIAARLNALRIAPRLWVPNGSLGTFGAVTRPESALRGRQQLWDFAAAGPMLGLIAAGVLFAAGLSMSTSDAVDPTELIPVPTFLFQGSIALGAICEGFLGPATDGKQLVHPFLIAGWCGLFTQAFNLLPVGCLDGGRMLQAAYGRSALNLASALTYLALVLGFVGGSMSLPFGLFVIFAQRLPERYVQDEVSEVSKPREYTTVVLVLLAVLILVPFSPDAPEVLDSMQASVQAQILAPPPDPSNLI